MYYLALYSTLYVYRYIYGMLGYVIRYVIVCIVRKVYKMTVRKMPNSMHSEIKIIGKCACSVSVHIYSMHNIAYIACSTLRKTCI